MVVVAPEAPPAGAGAVVGGAVTATPPLPTWLGSPSCTLCIFWSMHKARFLSR